ncbi:MAG: hypothetical protein HFJ04_03735 [Lachnospiraceae bacterium]|nr:hypothetical protein [Lachnospiraceae bacterium]
MRYTAEYSDAAYGFLVVELDCRALLAADGVASVQLQAGQSQKITE